MSFTNHRGVNVEFKVNDKGGLDYFVDGVKKVTDITSLEDDTGTLRFDGTACGECLSQRNTTPESAHLQNVNQGYTPPDEISRVLTLCRDLGGAPSSVSFMNIRGTAVEFRVNKNGNLDYIVAGVPKVTDITLLEDDQGTLRLDGTSMGPWKSHRRTTPSFLEDIERVLALHRGLGEV